MLRWLRGWVPAPQRGDLGWFLHGKRAPGIIKSLKQDRASKLGFSRWGGQGTAAPSALLGVHGVSLEPGVSPDRSQPQVCFSKLFLGSFPGVFVSGPWPLPPPSLPRYFQPWAAPWFAPIPAGSPWKPTGITGINLSKGKKKINPEKINPDKRNSEKINPTKQTPQRRFGAQAAGNFQRRRESCLGWKRRRIGERGCTPALRQLAPGVNEGRAGGTLPLF